MERIYTDTYDFEEIRENGAVYVDKTDRMLPLVDRSAGKQFFLARPRRFGKSLLLSTVKYLFQGRRDLFEGLAIADPAVGWDWEGEMCTVVHLDMSMCSGTMEQVERRTASQLREISLETGVPLRGSEADPGDMLAWLVRDAAAASPTGRCVLLVDEYDKPLLEHMGTPGVEPFRAFLKRIYGAVKATERFQRFCLLTGVSKFSKVSIFSDLNNLVDLTMSPLATTLLGYTHEEVRENFPEALCALADAHGTDAEGAFALLARWYDGYRFDKALVPVFNPVSLGRALADSDIRSYWFETGTPGWLMSYAKRRPMDIDAMEITDTGLGTFEPAAPDMTAVLFQTGYLTIAGVEARPTGTRYRLGFPNLEVSAGFNEWLAKAYTGAQLYEMSAWQEGCYQAVQTGDAEAFVESLQSFFSAIGYDLDDRLSEQAYQCVAVAILRFVGIACLAEVRTARGRIDMVCESAGHVFVMEVKVASGEAAGEAAAREALAQIRERGYADPYRADASTGRRRVQLLGMAFDCGVHNVSAWLREDL